MNNLEPDIVLDDAPEVVEHSEPNEIQEPVTESTEEEQKEIDPRKKQNVYQSFNITSDSKGSDITVAMPSDFDKETMAAIAKVPNISIMDTDDSREWASTLSDGMELNTFGDMYTSTLEDTTSTFEQKPDQNGKPLIAAAPRFKKAENETLKGERAVIRVLSHLGIGSLFQVPLWHSGMWLTIKPPTNSEIVELNRLMVADKVSFGRYTYGLAFSNISVYTINRLVDFALAHTYDLTAKSSDINLDNIKQHINCQDIPILLWGLICTMYPKGFKYRRACINDIEKCNHVLEETLNVTKLQWTNTATLSDWQRSHMADRQSKVKSLDEVNRYKNELVKMQGRAIKINKDQSNEIIFNLKTPSISEYVANGYKWISSLVDTIDSSLGLEANSEERNSYIMSKGQATSMRQYIHWVDSIECGSNIIDDVDTIEKTLDTISADDVVREEFLEEVVKYINESTISIVGIPVYDCPNCHEGQESEDTYPKITDVIPLDVVQLFFALLSKQLSRLATR